MKKLLCLFVCVISLCAVHAQGPLDATWKHVDTIMFKLPKSAGRIADSVYRGALAAHDPLEAMKAQLYLLAIHSVERKDEGDSALIQEVALNAAASGFPYKAIWLSIEAQLYTHYYQQHEYLISQRTQTDDAGNDMEFWDAKHFISKINELYATSLKSAERLRKIPNSDIYPIIQRGNENSHVRPSLYDLLLYRALEYYGSNVHEGAQDEFAFELDDAAAFAPANEFAGHRFVTSDTLSPQWRALVLYQQLLRMHAADNDRDAFIYADLQRLEQVKKNYTGARKDELYAAALQRIVRTFPGNAIAAMAEVRLAEMMMGSEGDYADKTQHADRTRDYTAILAVLDRIATRYPTEESGVTAYNMAGEIRKKFLEMHYEKVILPGEYSKVMLTYRNVSKVWVRIVPVSISTFRAFEYNHTSSDSLAHRPAVQAFAVALPASGDHRYHDVELKIDPLPVGRYGIWISDNDSFLSSEQKLLSSGAFEASELCMVQQQTARSTKQMLVMNRRTGRPVIGASILVRTTAGDKSPATILQTGTSNKAMIPANMSQSYQQFDVAKEHDTLVNALGSYSLWQRERKKDEFKTYFFTDRRIYRPGQTVYFKGITVLNSKGAAEPKIVAGKKEKVLLVSPNNDNIDSAILTTNEFGSYTGKFILPQTGLTGEMNIVVYAGEEVQGEQQISVEEYKRPKFNVTFNPVTGDYRINDRVTVEGSVLGFAGNNIDGATVKYTVTRTMTMPYNWLAGYYRASAAGSKQLEHGKTTTGADGKFKVTFTAEPDNAVDAASLPIYNYVVNADVMDINGETHSESVTVSAGHVSVRIVAGIPESATLSVLDSLPVTTQNLNSTFVQKKVHMQIWSLISPAELLRNREWSVPDKFLMDEAMFKKFFPHDVYKNEDEKERWPTGTLVFDKNVITRAMGSVVVPRATWARNGWYVVVLTTTDRSGTTVTDKKYVEVWDKTLSGRPTEALKFVAEDDAEPGKQAEVNLATAFTDDIYVLRAEQRMGSKVSYGDAVVTGSSYRDRLNITSADRGGITMKYLTFRNNRAYHVEGFIDVPWHKDLQISWETHRDKLLPGAKEQWTMIVKGDGKEKVAAEMAAVLYDASLDELRSHNWQMSDLFPYNDAVTMWAWSDFRGYQGSDAQSQVTNKYYDGSFDELFFPGGSSYPRHMLLPGYGQYLRLRESGNTSYMWRSKPAMATRNGYGYSILKSADVKDEEAPPPPPGVGVITSGVPASYGDVSGGAVNINYTASGGTGKQLAGVKVRTNLAETAFFYPQLHTDSAGNILIVFTMPEALTEWKLMTFAHTKQLAIGAFEGKVKTQKDLMVLPNLPRFLRQKDGVVLTAKVNNNTAKPISGQAAIELLDAQSLRPLNTAFKVADVNPSFTCKAGQSALVSWKIKVPAAITEPVVVRIKAAAGDFTDGEENTLPVLTDRMLVTESLPVYVNGNSTKNYHFDKLLHADSSKTLAHYSLTVEYTGNPAWYALQALPYLAEFPHECAEQTFNRYYANAIAAYIAGRNPKLEAIFRKWEKQDTAALLSNLDKNPELKSALLIETPWVMEAKSEREQKRRVALLFQTHRMAHEMEANLQKLQHMMVDKSGFPWFRGMSADRYITQYILTGMERLRHLGVKTSAAISAMEAQAIPWLDGEIKDDYSALLKSKADTSRQHISYTQIQYLYLRGMKGRGPSGNAAPAFSYYRRQAAAYWSSFNPYMQGMIALSLYRLGDRQTPAAIIASLRETAQHSDEMGMWWRQNGAGYWWYESPVEAQAIMIECFTEIAKDIAAVDAMKIWLLKQKQTQNWPTTTATADACYALLLGGSDWVTNEPEVSIQLGSETINGSDVKKEAGTGYFKTTYDGSRMQPQMGSISVTVSGNQHSTSWGAVSWQYFEDMDKITPATTPLVVRKKLYKEVNTGHGPELQPVSPSNPLAVGDKVRMRIEISVDRDMEYVHLKDMRAACFEPVNVISEYKYQDGLGYYESTRDASSNFFFSTLPKGKYVFEYPVFVMAKGDFSNGITTIQCMYAPEFNAHTEGMRVRVE